MSTSLFKKPLAVLLVLVILFGLGLLSALLMSASIASLFVNKAVRGEYMNWTIDFRGGTEIIYAFKDKATGAFTSADPGKVRGDLPANRRHRRALDRLARRAGALLVVLASGRERLMTIDQLLRRMDDWER